MSGFSASTRQSILARDRHRCARCGCALLHGFEVHHRRPRGLGGVGKKNRVTNSAANGVTLCMMCHRWVESHRETARELGLLVPQGIDPSTVLVWAHDGVWIYDAFGGRHSQEHDF